MYEYPEGWTTDDFADTLNSEPREDDPWAVQSGHDELGPDSSGGDSEAKREPAISGQANLSASDFTDDSDPDSSEINDQDGDPLDGPWSSDRESHEERAILQEWDEEQPSSAGVVKPDTLGDIEVDNPFLDEPEPSAEYDSELGQPLYELDYDILDLHRTVTVNEWVASIDEISDAELEEITALLLEFSQSRLRRWLPWLREKQWTGQSLLLFLQFRAYWDENENLWECLQWSPGLKFWRQVLNRNSLSLNNSYLLVQRRSHCSADEVIAPEWFEDWDSLDLWVRVTQGFYAFSSFVMYRSQLNYAEDSRLRPDLQADFDAHVKDSSSKMSKLDFPAHRYGPRLWFAGQDWYDPVEWHDGLGW